MNLTTSKGATLAVSLVMLTSVTLLALVSLQRSALQSKMVSNFQIKQTAYDIAYSEVEAKFQDSASQNSDNQNMLAALNSVQLGDNGVAQRDPVTNAPLTVPVNLAAESRYGHPNMAIATNLRYTGTPTSLNHTLSGDSSKGEFTEYQFRIESQVNATNNIGSHQAFGFSYKVASGR